MPDLLAANENTITFRVDGVPQAQPRQRAYAAKIGGRWTTRTYDPGTAAGWKELVAIQAREHAPETPLEGPIVVHCDFIFPRPKRLLVKSRPDGRIAKATKPDVDNALKAAMDVMTSLAFWRDDAQVYSAHGRKWFCARDEKPGAVIEINWFDELPSWAK